jgi:hypothetical protein
VEDGRRIYMEEGELGMRRGGCGIFMEDVQLGRRRGSRTDTEGNM